MVKHVASSASFCSYLFYWEEKSKAGKCHAVAYYNVINQVISYWTSYRSEVSCIGPRPEAEVQYS